VLVPARGPILREGLAGVYGGVQLSEVGEDVVKEGGPIVLLSKEVAVAYFVGVHICDGADPVEASDVDREDDLVECKRVSTRESPVPAMDRREMKDSVLSGVSYLEEFGHEEC
jgi:hypothetical protein